MCHDDLARPPLPPTVTGSATGRDVVLTAADGNRFLAYEATPEHPTGPRFVLVPDVRGLHPFYRELALTFARAGIGTVAIDVYARTAGIAWRGDNFDVTGDEHAVHLSRTQALDDVRAAAAYLGDGPTYVVGFCYGGGMALVAGASDLPLAGVIAFYPYTGAYGVDDALPDDFVAGIRVPVLGLFGDADHAVPIEKPRAFERHLSDGRQDIVIFPGEGHGFFEEPADGSTAPAQAWDRLLEFVAG